MYPNGRARGPGRWTRAGLGVKRPPGKPLPFSLQVLPMRMSPTPVHPGCVTESRQYGMAVDMAEWPPSAFRAGRGLRRTQAGRWEITVGSRTFYSDDATYALAWVSAANHYRNRIGAVLTMR